MSTAVVIGASRGLGLGLVAEYLARGWTVVATERTPSAGLAALACDRLTVARCDAAEPADVTALTTQLAGTSIDLLFVVAGIGGRNEGPFTAITAADFAELMRVNALAPLMVSESFLPLLAPEATVALMTSGLGSITLNTTGAWEAYRASKAALNMLARSFAVRHPALRVRCVAPGWVKTDMGGPNALITVETSVKGMVYMLEARKAEPGALFVNYQNAELPR